MLLDEQPSRRPPGAARPRRPDRAQVSLLPPVGPLPLPVRNRLAELILEAFEPGGAGDRAGAGERRRGGSEVERRRRRPSSRARAGSSRLAPAGSGSVGAHRAHGPEPGGAVCAGGVGGPGLARPRTADDMARLLDRAAALANHGLFFEVHELLEPVWFRASEPERTALQG